MVPFVSPQSFLETFLVHFVDTIIHSLFTCEVTVAGSTIQIYGGTVLYWAKMSFRFDIEKFDGRINFGLWQVQVKDILI